MSGELSARGDDFLRGISVWLLRTANVLPNIIGRAPRPLRTPRWILQNTNSAKHVSEVWSDHTFDPSKEKSTPWLVNLWSPFVTILLKSASSRALKVLPRAKPKIAHACQQ
jgi:hypothetical protein